MPDLSNDALASAPGGAVMLPATAGMVVVSYNLPGVTEPLRLSRAALAEFSRVRSRTGTIP